MSHVLVLDTDYQPLEPCHPAEARQLLTAGEAAVYRRYPFTIILKGRLVPAVPPPLRLKIDPGSQTTGLAVVNDDTGEIVWAAELHHRGAAIQDALARRRAVRRSRRKRKTRYRAARFRNRRRRAGWLPPSLASRVRNILTWVSRLRRLCPIQSLAVEVVRFDTQALQNPEISGVAYQQGELAGYEVREYLLEKWGRRCAYCDATDIPLQIDHIVARTCGGSDRVSNLTLACEPCNQAKGNQDVGQFLAHDHSRLARLRAQAKAPLKDAAAVNSTRQALYHALVATDLPIEASTGGWTKYNRAMRGLDKSHWADAVCVGPSTPPFVWSTCLHPLTIWATGRGSRQMCRVDKYGFPRTGPKQAKRVQGFQTGDMIAVRVPSGTKAGCYIGRVAVRRSGYFDLRTSQGKMQGLAARHCRLLHRADGYAYA